MSKNKKEAIQDNEPTGELTREERIEEIDKLVSTLDETLEVFGNQLDESQADLKDLDVKQAEQLEGILNKLPQGATPKGILDEILKAATPQRTQILNNISKLQASIKIETVKKNKLGIEKRKIEEAIREEGLNTLTERLCETLQDMIDMYLKAEAAFILFKEKAAELDMLDSRYDKRVDGKKYLSFFNEIAGLSLLRVGSLPGLTMTYFVETIQNIGPDTENPLKAGRFARKETQPMHRDITGKPVEPQTPDSEAADKLSEIFEPGPHVPTY